MWAKINRDAVTLVHPPEFAGKLVPVVWRRSDDTEIVKITGRDATRMTTGLHYDYRTFYVAVRYGVPLFSPPDTRPLNQRTQAMAGHMLLGAPTQAEAIAEVDKVLPLAQSPAAAKVRLEIVRGSEGLALYLDDQRIAGPKPWGGGKALHCFMVDRAELHALTKPK